MKTIINFLKKHRKTSILGLVLGLFSLIVNSLGFVFYTSVTTFISWVSAPIIVIPLVIILFTIPYFIPIIIFLFPKSEKYINKFKLRLKNKIKEYNYKKLLSNQINRAKSIFFNK